MTPELYRQAIQEQKRKYDKLLEVAAEMRDILDGLCYWHNKEETIDQSWWDAADQVTKSDYLELQPSIAVRLRAVHATARMVLEESQEMCDTGLFYHVSFENMLALEGACGDVERAQAERLLV